MQEGCPFLPPSVRWTGKAGGHVRPNHRRPGNAGARPRHGIERGGRGDAVEVLTSGGDRGEAPDFEAGRRRCGRPTVVFMHGGAPALGWRRGAVEDTRLDVAKLLVAATCSGRASRRRIDDGRRRGSMADGARAGRGTGGGGKVGARARGSSGALP
jgi:hypothetical protein